MCTACVDGDVRGENYQIIHGIILRWIFNESIIN